MRRRHVRATVIRDHARHPAARAAALVLATLALVAGLAATGSFATLSAALDDFLVRVTRAAGRPESVLVVDFDDASLQALRPTLGAWPYGRDVAALLVDFLRESGARRIVLDVVLADERDGDAQLARRLDGHDDVVLAAAAVGAGVTRPPVAPADAVRLSRPAVAGEAALSWSAIELPTPVLRRSLPGPASLGVITTPLDEDGQLRRLPLLHVAGGRAWPSLALAALAGPGAAIPAVDADAHELRLGGRRWPVDALGRIRFSFADSARRLHALPARAVLDAALGRTAPDEVRAAVRERIVFVGSSAFLGDRVMTSAGQLPGLAVIAAEVDALRREDLVGDAPRALTAALGALALLPLLLSVRRARPTPRLDSATVVATGTVIVAIGVVALQAGRVLVPLAGPLAILATGFALDALAQWGRSVQANLRLAEERRLADAANAAKSDFLACMSHELRTPLHAMLGMADALAQTPLDAAQRHRVEVLRQSGTALAGLIDDLLDLSRIEADRLALHPEPFALRELLEAQRALFEVRARDKGLALTLQVADEAGATVDGDAKRFAQVIVNLVGNAIKFTRQGGVAIVVDRLHGGADEGLLHVAVRDTGIGIAPSKLEAIFEPFSQADGSITRHFGGTGLGLSITRRLVELMGGRVWVESRAGAGSTFHVAVRLPVVAGSNVGGQGDAPQLPGVAAAAPESATAPAAGDDDRVVDVLLAEDNEVNVMVMQAMLEGTPYRIDAAPSGEVALERFRAGAYGLVLMDIHMPGMDGYAATRALRAIERRGGREPTPVLALTASALDTDRAASLAAGCDDHLVKPIGRRQLLDAIARWGRVAAEIERRQRRRAHAVVFLGSWQRSFDAARAAGDAARARALCEDLAEIAAGIGDDALAQAGGALAQALGRADADAAADATRAAAARVARELGRAIVALAPAA